MKTHRFLACFRVGHCFIKCEGSARVHGSFGAFLADMTGHRDAEPESLSIEIQGYFIPIY